MRSVPWLLLGSGLALACSGGIETSGRTPDTDESSTPGQSGPVTGPKGSAGAAGSNNVPSTSPSFPVLTPGQPAPPPNFNMAGEPFYSRAVQLTNAQWARAVQDVLKLPAAPTQANSFLRAVGGFTTFVNNERVLEVSNDLRESYQLAAKEIADEVGTDANIKRVAAGTEAAAFIEALGRRAYRRPLTADETARYQDLYDVGSKLSGTGTAFTKGAKLVVEAMIQSPNFLYRTELGAAGSPLSGYEVAAKLSLWLRGTTPSDALLDQAESGMFDSETGVATLADTMLAEKAATAALTEMHSELLKFSRFSEVVKFTDEYAATTNEELETASRMFFDRIYEQGLGLHEILTGTKGYMGPAMAKLYGLRAPTGTALKLQDFGAERPGYFAQVPALALYGDNTHSDAIHRGLALNMVVMCADLPKPDFQVALPPEPVVGQSDRVRMELHTGVGTCGETCHGNYINPLGYAFENFDGLGRIRTTDADEPVNTVSSYPFADGIKTFDGAVELMNLIAESDEAHNCYAKNLMSFALQRDIIAADMPSVTALAAVSKAGTGSLKTMVRELVKSPAFRVRSSGSTL